MANGSFKSVEASPLKNYDFERFDHESWRLWINQHWTFVFYASALYICGIYYGQKHMENRKPLRTKKYLRTWNFLQALISSLVFIRMVPELGEEIRTNGLFISFCVLKSNSTASKFWGAIFCFSKILDFGDTVFLILAKKPVTFLHWYHHVSVACYCLFIADVIDPATRWFAVMNSFVHAVMYLYFGLKAMDVQISTKVAMAITTLQLSQMVVGIYINSVTYYYKSLGTHCERPYKYMEVALLMYASYFILFAQFFYQAYVNTTGRSKKKII